MHMLKNKLFNIYLSENMDESGKVIWFELFVFDCSRRSFLFPD